MADKSITGFVRAEGKYSRQAHCDIPENCYEREIGRDGFYGPATHIYHSHPPTGWTRIEGPLRPRAFDSNRLSESSLSPWFASELFFNQQTRIAFWQIDQTMPELARNADGDLLFFIHQGGGNLYCDYGHLQLNRGDYLVIPRGTMWRIEVDEKISALMVEASDNRFSLPDKGLLGQHAIFDPAVLDTPCIDDQFKAQQTEDEWKVSVKRDNNHTTLVYPYNPLDAVGWKGMHAPLRINWRDIRPVMSHRYHIPPSVHSTFIADGVVICTFCPRLLETDPQSLRVPFFHNNDDYDEVIFYHQGDFFSRDNIQPGMLTLHPCGITHGPQPKAFASGKQASRQETDEVAVMIDTRRPLQISNNASSIEFNDYVNSWKGETP